MKYLDTRDLSKRLDELEEELEELEELRELRDEIREWSNGVTLIPESEFEDYARDLAEDIGAVSGDKKWPATCIDWEEAARELKYDYSACEYQGTTYYYRS